MQVIPWMPGARQAGARFYIPEPLGPSCLGEELDDELLYLISASDRPAVTAGLQPVENRPPPLGLLHGLLTRVRSPETAWTLFPSTLSEK